jgi:hypothetical protein
MVNKWDNVNGLVQRYFETDIKDWSDERVAVLQDAMNGALEDIILCDAYLHNVYDSRPYAPVEPEYATIKELHEYRRAKDAYNVELANYMRTVNTLKDERQNARSFIFGIFNRTGFSTFNLCAFGSNYHYSVHSNDYYCVSEGYTEEAD